jgi:hypothetical protein
MAKGISVATPLSLDLAQKKKGMSQRPKNES